MPKLLKTLTFAALGLALGACAGHPTHEEPPHHFSKDAHGSRIACYATDVSNEYECVPVYRRYAAYPYPYYDPYWSAGFIYGWPHHHDVIVVRDPPANPPPPPPHWRRRSR